jgi:hypothetical protein
MSNWRLPSTGELNAMYIQLHKKGMGGFGTGSYWSSSEVDDCSAWHHNFSYSYRDFSCKGNHFRIRFIRHLSDAASHNGLIFSVDGQTFEAAEKDEPELMTWDEAMKKGGINE